MGKTAFALSAILNMGREGKKRIGYFSLEESANSLVKRLISMESKVCVRRPDLEKAGGEEIIAVSNAAKAVSKLGLIINDIPDISISEIANELSKDRMANLDILFIDSLELIRDEGNYRSEEERMNYICSRIRMLSDTYNVPVFVLSNIAKSAEDNKNFIPKLKDLRNLNIDPSFFDAIGLLYREDYYLHLTGKKSLSYVFIVRNRFGQNGRWFMAWDRKNNTFSNDRDVISDIIHQKEEDEDEDEDEEY